MGMEGFPPVMASGQLGSEFSMFKTPSANRRVYDYVPVLPRDSVRYIIHASLDDLTFDPDILIITANPAQAEVLLRASSYSDGRMWNAKRLHLSGLRVVLRLSVPQGRTELRGQRSGIQHEGPACAARGPDHHLHPFRDDVHDDREPAGDGVGTPLVQRWGETASSKRSKTWKPGYPRTFRPSWSGDSRPVERRAPSAERKEDGNITVRQTCDTESPTGSSKEMDG